jgi:sugar/nucleoside kinase (ribokinase family)
MCGGEAAIQADGLTERGNRGGKVTAVGDDHTDRVVRHGVCRIQCNRRAKGGQRRRGVAGGQERGAALPVLRCAR